MFDVVACQFGVMFFPDKAKAYREAARVLKPGGRFAFNVWDSLASNEFPGVISHALAALFPKDPPRFLERTPYGYHDTAAIEAALSDAGFSDVEVEAVERVSRAPSPRDPAIGFCQGSPLRAEIEARDPAGVEKATDAAAQALAQRFGPGPIEGRICAQIFTARRR
jgi:SAM-dependent methyltransferase